MGKRFEKELNRAVKFENLRRHPVDEICCGGYSITPKNFRYVGGKRKAAGHLEKVSVLALGNPVLLRSVDARTELENAFGGEKRAEGRGKALLSIIGFECLDGSVELCLNH